MSLPEKRLERLDRILRDIIQDWYERVRPHYVTEEESRQLGVEPEIKHFHDDGSHRIKFARVRELDVTYGIRAVLNDDRLYIESSVNNKSSGFDYESFVERLQSHYWRSRNEKPWTEAGIDRFAYGDLLQFEPQFGRSVLLEAREEKADIIRLLFHVNPKYEDLLMSREDVLRDLIENYCLAPMKWIYAESYREQQGSEPGREPGPEQGS